MSDGSNANSNANGKGEVTASIIQGRQGQVLGLLEQFSTSETIRGPFSIIYNRILARCTMVLLRRLTEEMVRVAEKAARLARAIRSEKVLFDLLVQEKTGSAKNERFEADFKTLADVLIQEMVKHDLGLKFAGLSDHIYGEESNVFENTLGQSVTMEVGDHEGRTKNTLCKILDGNENAASLLARIVHSEAAIAADVKLDDVSVEVDVSDTGIWIDPIDSTAQYIHGSDGDDAASDVNQQAPYQKGLQCVTVLIGAFHHSSGRPLAGVIQQPFYMLDSATATWSGRCVWGISHNGVNLHNSNVCVPTIKPTINSEPTVNTALTVNSERTVNTECSVNTEPTLVFSSCDAGIRKLSPSFRTCTAAGAGYKALCVIDGCADAYVLTMDTTFKWDTCAPHAVLLARGGGILSCGSAKQVLNVANADADIDLRLEECQLSYHKPDSTSLPASKHWSNSHGIIAYREMVVAVKILKALI